MVFEGTALIAGPSFRSGPARLYTGFRGNPIPKLSKPPDPPLGQTRKEANFAHYTRDIVGRWLVHYYDDG
jgi:hypothetical protein